VKSIAIFNNKGGVGKTTLLSNLASYMALREGSKILVVDADPQCNATQSLFPDVTVEAIYEENGFTVDSIIRPLAQGKGFSDELTPLRSSSFGVDVIPGDPRLSLTEDLLATDWVSATSGNTRGLRTSFVFSNLLDKCQDYDLVIFDMGPSLGSINRSVLLATDYFLTPMSLDIFSLRAIDNISASVNKWRGQITRGLNDNDERDELEISNPDWNLKFLGYVTQQYTFKKDSSGHARPVRAFEQIMEQIPSRIRSSFLQDQQPPLTDDQANLGTIPTLHSLIPMSQTSRKPIFELKAADGVVGAHFQKVKEFDSIISDIAGKLRANLETLS
jgi:cellulose biosynthesis protein BcsQ